jgi:hypothetical protein
MAQFTGESTWVLVQVLMLESEFMDITELEADFFQKGVNFVHFSPNIQRCKRAEKAFLAKLLKRSIPLLPEVRSISPSWRARFMSCTLSGASCEHVPVVIFEDFDSMDPRVRDEALLVPSPMDGHQPMIIKVW